MPPDDLAAAIVRLTGSVPQRLRPAGGDLSEVYAASLADGAEVIVKTGALTVEEAGMLRAIAASGCPAPRVIGAEPGVIVMSRLAAGGQPGRAAWAGFGAALRRLHDTTGTDHGWPQDHAFGRVAIPNAPASDWPAFWAERRLMAAPSALSADISTRVERLAARLPELLPGHPAPSLLHGDLWAGNVLWGPGGFSGVIDPACYYGHAEVDLAMLQLFGRIGNGFCDGYGVAEPGEAERRPVYQLWPALVHLRLFGAGYLGMVERLLEAAGA